MSNSLMNYFDEERNYHNMDHIRSMLYNLKTLTTDSISEKELFNLRTAIVYHDVVYTPGESNNEELSIEEFKHDYRTYGKDFLQSVSRLIWVTKEHSVIEGNESEKIIIDLDLWNLSDQRIYKLSLERVKNEFLHKFSLNEFNKGRITWIKKMLNREKLFYTDYCIENNFHELSKANLLTELNTLNK